jgi:hypothetical protein
MVESKVVPTYQINLIRHKPLFGIELTEAEQELVSSTPESPLSEYLRYLKSNYPKRFEEIITKTKVAPISNYRENYKAGQLLLKAYDAGITSKFPETLELNKFQSAYRYYNLFNTTKYIGIALGLWLINYGAFRPTIVSRTLVANGLFIAVWLTFINNQIENKRREFIPYQHAASLQYKDELFKLHDRNELVYQYKNVLESFPPDLYALKNKEFLVSKALYEQAHGDDFNGLNRRKSQYTLYKENADRLV